MKICYLHLARYPTQQANAVHVMNMCAAMAELGHEVTLVVRAARDSIRGFQSSLHEVYGVAEAFDIQVISDHQFFIRSQLQGRNLRRLLEDRRPELIYTRTTKFTNVWRELDIPYVFETHVMPRHRPRMGLTRRTLLSKNFRRLVVISHSLAEDFGRAFPELTSEYVLVCPDAASSRAVERPAVQSGFCAGYVGHLYPGKGMETIAAVAPRLADVRFEVVGGTPEDIRTWQERTHRTTNIRFIGHVPHRDVFQYIAGFDVALAPFGRRVEALKREISSWFSPLKIFEYMAQGRAIVAADLPVLREVLEHGRNAWLVEPEDAEAWVHAVVTLREDAALRRRLGYAAFEDFRQRYTWTERARKVLERLPETAMPVGGRRPGS